MTAPHGMHLPGPAPAVVAILVVGGDEETRTATVRALEPLGHAIVEARSGEAALSVLTQRTFAVILMDVALPGINGYEVVERIRMRSTSEYTPLILMASPARDEARVPIAYASGATDFVVVPVDPAILRAKVSAYVDLFAKTRALEQAVSHAKALNEEFRDSEVRTRAVLEHVADGIVTVTSAGMVETVNRAAVEMFGFDEDEVIGQSFALMIDFELSPESGDELTIQELLAQHAGGDRTVEWFGRRKGGGTFPMSFGLSDVQLGDRRLYVACVRDESEQQTYTEALRHRAMHDELTGLPNRVLFADRANQAISATARSGEPLALMVLDLDRFKERQRHARPPPSATSSCCDAWAYRLRFAMPARVRRGQPASAATSSPCSCSTGADAAGAGDRSGRPPPRRPSERPPDLVLRPERRRSAPASASRSCPSPATCIGDPPAPRRPRHVRRQALRRERRPRVLAMAAGPCSRPEAPGAARATLRDRDRAAVTSPWRYQPKIDAARPSRIDRASRRSSAGGHPTDGLLDAGRSSSPTPSPARLIDAAHPVGARRRASASSARWRDAGLEPDHGRSTSPRDSLGATGSDLPRDSSPELTDAWSIAARTGSVLELTESAVLDSGVRRRCSASSARHGRGASRSTTTAPATPRSSPSSASRSSRARSRPLLRQAASRPSPGRRRHRAARRSTSPTTSAAAAERWFESSPFGMPRVPAGEAPVDPARPLRLTPHPRCDAEKPTIVLRLLEIASALSPAEDEAVALHDEADETAA